MWAFLTKLGWMRITGAAFAMRAAAKIGGWRLGNSRLKTSTWAILEQMGYKIVLGPFVECHVDKIEKEKSFNYAKRIASGIRAHIAVDLPLFV